MIETPHARLFHHTRPTHGLNDALLQPPRSLALEVVANRFRIEGLALQFEIEPQLPRPLALFVAFAGTFAQLSGVGGDEGEQVGECRNAERIKADLWSELGRDRR